MGIKMSRVRKVFNINENKSSSFDSDDTVTKSFKQYKNYAYIAFDGAKWERKYDPNKVLLFDAFHRIYNSKSSLSEKELLACINDDEEVKTIIKTHPCPEYQQIKNIAKLFIEEGKNVKIKVEQNTTDAYGKEYLG